MVDGAAKMSSSKIIKATGEESGIGSFNFQALSHSTSLTKSDITSSPDDNFRPFDLFDTSELANSSSYIKQPEPNHANSPALTPEQPGKFITDDDLQRYQQESYQRGLQDGKNLAERGLLNVFKGLRTATEDLQILREKIFRDSEDDLLALTMAITRKVVGREAAQDRKIVLRLIRTALLNLNSQDELVIRVHPDDYALLATTQSEDLKTELSSIKFTLKPDSTIEIGSCQVESERGTVDAGFAAQLDEVYRRLLEERTENSSLILPEE